MEQNILEQIGLTTGETKVYLALLELGSTTTGPIVDKSEVSASKVYEILDRLSKKGLVSHIIKEKTKYFSAADPTRILDYLDEKEKEIVNKKEQIKGIIPELELKQKMTKAMQEAEIYEGIKGIKTARENLLKTLKKGDTLIIMGAPVEANIMLESWLLDFHIRREKIGIGVKILYNKNAKKYGKKRENLKLTEVKYMEEDVVTPAWIEIYNDITAILLLSKTPLVFVVKNKEVSDSFRKYFDLLWNQKVIIYKGREAAEFGDEDIIKEGKETIAFGMGRKITARKYPDLVKEFIENRIKHKIKERFLLNEKPSEEEKRIAYNHLYTEYKIVPKQYFSPVTTLVYGNKVSIWIWSEKEELTVMRMEDKKLADYYRNYFEMLWQEETRIYTGIEGVKEAHEKTLEVLKPGDVFYFLGASVISSEKLRAYWQDYHKRREKKGVHTKILFNQDVPKLELDNRNSFKYCEARYMPIPIKTPIWIEVVGDLTTIGIPTENPHSIEIKNKEVADGFKNYFEAFWEMTKKA